MQMRQKHSLVLILILALAVILSLPAGVFAASTTITVSADKTEAEPGDTVTFEVVFGNSNASYKWPSTVTYDYKLVYFGDNPSADIIDLS